MRTRSVIIAVLAGFRPAEVVDAPGARPKCPGNPNALGTSRTLVLEPATSPDRAMQYCRRCRLKTKNRADVRRRPIPPYSDRVLDILASESSRSRISSGRRDRARHRLWCAGSIGRSTPSAPTAKANPSRFQKCRGPGCARKSTKGIADVSAALGDNRELAPFFRIPGLARTDIIERELSARSLVVFSSDTVADDWHRRIRPKDIISRAVSRLEARGKGILLLHDIHQSTVLALPGLFKELKDKGFHIVHVVAGSGHAVETASVPPWINNRSDPSWPQNLSGPESNRIALPVPDPNRSIPAICPGRRSCWRIARRARPIWRAPARPTGQIRRRPKRPRASPACRYPTCWISARRWTDGRRQPNPSSRNSRRRPRISPGSDSAGQIVRKRLEIGIGQIVSDLAHRGHAGTDARRRI